MRRYETVWVVNGDLPDEEVKATIDKFTRIITGQGGVLVGVEEWGRRKLAYKIGNTLRGSYVMADFAGLPAVVKELERNYRIDDRVIRYLTIKKSDKVNLGALQEEIDAKSREAARKAEAAQAAAAALEAVVVPEETAAPAPEPAPEAPAEAVAPEKEE